MAINYGDKLSAHLYNAVLGFNGLDILLLASLRIKSTEKYIITVNKNRAFKLKG